MPRTRYLLVAFVIGASLAIHALLLKVSIPGVLAGDLIDPDSFMRMVRVRELVQGGGWFDPSVARSNWPYGDVLHWTRPFDAVLATMTLVLRPFLGLDRALHAVAIVISPLMQVAVSLGLFWAVRPLLDLRLRTLMMVGILAQPGFIGYALPGRPDHHIPLLLGVILFLGALTRALGAEAPTRNAALAGGCAALGVWLSPELLLPIGVALGMIGLYWMSRGEHARLLVHFSTAFLCGCVLALALERSPATWGHLEYDRISAVHVGLATMLLVGAWILARASRAGVSRPARLALGLLVAAGVALGLRLAFPGFFRGPYAELDARVVPVWFSHISENEPLWPRGPFEVGRLVAYLGIAMVAPLLGWWAARRDPRNREAWYLWVAVQSAYTMLALIYNVRFAPGAELFALPAAVFGLGLVLGRVEARWNGPLLAVTRAAVIVAALVGPLFLGGGLMSLEPERVEAPADAVRCDLRTFSAWLTGPVGPGSEPRTILATMDYGPELLYRTPHRVVAGPYHRNASGILAIHDALTTTDAPVRDGILREREIDWILLCPSYDGGFFRKEGYGAEGLYGALLEGDPVAGIAQIQIPDSLGDFRLFSVEREALSGPGSR